MDFNQPLLQAESPEKALVANFLLLLSIVVLPCLSLQNLEFFKPEIVVRCPANQGNMVTVCLKQLEYGVCKAGGNKWSSIDENKGLVE